MTSAILTQLGRYQLKRVIGRGAMGLVYEGLDPRLERKVAVKTILKSHLLDAAMAREYSARFVREAQAAARLNHPNIVTVFDFGEQDDVAYLVMEFIDGRELAAHFDDNDFFDLPQAVRIVGELLDALGYAHERGIVHRDVKPANVMIDTTGRVKLADFGVARLADAGTDRTQPGTMVGTPSYMSPEQIQGLAVGSRTDLFAVGVVLYQFLTRQKPFTGGGQWTVQKKIVQEEPVPPSFANRAVPPVFDAIMQRALAKDPENRYASAAEFAADLRQALGKAPELARFDPDATVVRPAKVSAPATVAPATRASVPVEALSTAPPVPAVPQDEVTVQVAAPDAPAAPAVASPAAVRPTKLRAWAGGTLVLAGVVSVIAWRLASESAPAPSPAVTPATVAAPAVNSPAPTESVAPLPSPQVTVAASAAVLPPPPGGGDRPASAARVVESPPAVAQPPRVAATKANVRSAAPSPAPDARCSELLQRIQLGETLSPESLEVFQKECRR